MGLHFNFHCGKPGVRACCNDLRARDLAMDVDVLILTYTKFEKKSTTLKHVLIIFPAPVNKA